MLTNRGILTLLFAAPIIAAGTWLPALEWVAAAYVMLCAALFIFDRRSAGDITRFQATRIHDTKLSLGADNPVRLEIRNRSRFPADFQVRDEPPDAFTIHTRILRGETKPRHTWEGTYYVQPLRRGDYAFGDINLRWRGPLGLVIRQGQISAKTPVKVYPNLMDVRRYDLLLKQNRLQEMGLRHARLFGEGTEFERLREYQPDDEFRRINWKATARRHRPVTTEYQTERSQNIFIAIDSGRMMRSPVEKIAKLDYVVNAALLLAYVATGKGDKVGMMTFSDDVRNYLTPKQGRGQFYRMLEILYGVEPEPIEPDYPLALNYLGLKQRKRSLMIIFTDLSGGISMQSLVAHAAVLGRRSLLLVVTISDPDVFAAAHQSPVDTHGVYQRAAAAQLLDERSIALETLQRHGVLTLDVPANQLSMSVINRYLALKGKMRI